MKNKVILSNKGIRISSMLMLLCLVNLSSCSAQNKVEASQDLFTRFQKPPAEARPFVRWWWNGNKIKTQELDRELESLKSVGFGGVEINPIAMPVAPENEDESLVWMSDEWIDMVVYACKKTKDLGMISDVIAGTGWPFGGEVLKDDETCQRMVSDYISYKGESVIEIDEASLIAIYKNKYDKSRSQAHISKRTTYKLSYLKLIPEHCEDVSQVIDLEKYVATNGKINYQIKGKGNYLLSFGIVQQNFRDVTLGAPGGAGPVMDHYKKEMTLAYLNRLKKISERSGYPLSDLIRALFCDSIEVSGANWTDGFDDLFYNAYGYKLDNWKPFIFYEANLDYSKNKYSEKFTTEFIDQLKRVRYDYNKLLVEVFLKNFTQTYKDFCEENNILCRYQAYGTPFLMGMLDGYMIPDIPESNNWIYTVEMKDSVWDWKQSHGYMTWNMYASAGAHLSGKKITSCETMTNLQGVFKATLEEIKQHDDMNFITGINHSVLHGYNYSPPEVEFPGWIRFGTYFSEQNTWWKHLQHWVDYNSRLSYVFQNSQADKSIAIVGPTADIWGDKGLIREPFHMEPEYLYRLWEPISQLGYSAEYINIGILERATTKDGKIKYGNMTYKLLVLASLKSLSSKAAANIKTFVESGGKVVVIDQLPIKSLHYSEFEKNDALVKDIMTNLLVSYPNSFIQTKQPESIDELISWTESILKTAQLEADVAISNPTKNVYQIHQYTNDKDIYFFTNVNRFETIAFHAKFPVTGKYPYIWNPETGEKKPYYFVSNSNKLSITLNPLQSLLLVFENEKPKVKALNIDTEIKKSKTLDVNWKVIGKRKDGKTFTWNMSTLGDFSKSIDSTQYTFGGEIIYKTTINNSEDFTHLDLGNVNEGVTELYINGQKVGKRWYGKAVYAIADYLIKGDNEIEIHYTTVLANYAKSLKNNEMVHEWTKRYKNLVPTGMEGPVKFLKY
ncbi:hypothetical protein EC396_14545 [Lutibacter sp. HS1-25]|uniref:glycosyl hydrolase n=1 Tax=Lutibacter sp. HS1-25 TaxID=2485000 RepID=UPI001012BB8A|nr:glycosyl hydrolase [Lutibacter sp. HS1-25]RXP46224.1 hypothetical protein EC396_14545 [Lutibacter sp. HS1-25]